MQKQHQQRHGQEQAGAQQQDAFAWQGLLSAQLAQFPGSQEQTRGGNQAGQQTLSLFHFMGHMARLLAGCQQGIERRPVLGQAGQPEKQKGHSHNLRQQVEQGVALHQG